MTNSRSTAVLIVGAGQAGLAMSACLGQRGIEHVVLERGEIGHAWRHERWDSLRLLTPNWQTRLPGADYAGANPDGFMTAAEVAAWLADYASGLTAPIHEHAAVTRVTPNANGYRVDTTAGSWQARAVVMASGACSRASVPALADGLPPQVFSTTAFDYKRPGDLPEGDVLIVGASASGLQIGQELLASGRPVTLSVGEHVRMSRSYRGRDIQVWLERTGLLDERWDTVDDLVRARNVPSPQLYGDAAVPLLDLNALTDRGATLVGRLAALRDGTALFSGSLKNVCQLADLKMNRLLRTIDEWLAANHAGVSVPGETFERTRVPEAPPLTLDLARGGIASVVWATGYRPDFDWLDVPVFDRRGRLRHDGGVVDAPGLYVLGLTFLRRRKSSFIHGTGDDARDLADHLAGYLA